MSPYFGKACILKLNWGNLTMLKQVGWLFESLESQSILSSPKKKIVGIFCVQDWVLSPDAIHPMAHGSVQIRDTILCIVSHCFWKREFELFGKLLLLAHGEGVGAFPIPFSGLRHIWKGRDFTSCIIIIWKQGLDLRFRAFLYKTLLSNPPSPPPPPPPAPSLVLFACYVARSMEVSSYSRPGDY